MKEEKPILTPKEGRHVLTFLNEPTPSPPNAVLTTSAVENIAAHQYKVGEYTYLDNFFNPFWQFLTNLLPMTLAPNMVTTIGMGHCFIAYLTVWYYSYNFDSDSVPSFVIFLCGYCTAAYFTLDCMDGKQARRTGTSSPLGQLFDHGLDCLCNLSHVSATCSFLGIGDTMSYMLLQNALQITFLVAQWEEYHTGNLATNVGGIFGVTESNYGMALIMITNALIDRTKFWKRKVADVRIWAFVLNSGGKSSIGGVRNVLLEMELRELSIIIWAILCAFLFVCALVRTKNHFVRLEKEQQGDSAKSQTQRCNGTFTAALLRLFTPVLVFISPFLIPRVILTSYGRSWGLASGLLFVLLTNKMILFGMANTTFAVVQIDALPYLICCAWMRFDHNLTTKGAGSVFGCLAVWYAFRLITWARSAIEQLCNRLDIYCFTIKKKEDIGKKKED